MTALTNQSGIFTFCGLVDNFLQVLYVLFDCRYDLGIERGTYCANIVNGLVKVLGTANSKRGGQSYNLSTESKITLL